MTSSPILFDIYTESLLEQFERAQLGKVFLRLFADDLVLICHHSVFSQCTATLEKWSKENNMRINKKKSAVMILNPSTDTLSPAINEYPVALQYKYLGTYLTQELSLLPHLKEVSKKVNFITFKLRSVLGRGHMRLNCNLFKVFVLPNFRLLLTLIESAHTNQLKLVEK